MLWSSSSIRTTVLATKRSIKWQYIAKGDGSNGNQWIFKGGSDDDGSECYGDKGCKMMSFRPHYFQDNQAANVAQGYGFEMNLYPNYDQNGHEGYPYEVWRLL